MRKSIVAFLPMLACVTSAAHAADGISGPKWLIESVKGAGVIDTAQTVFQIAEDGCVSTTIGCNRMGASAKIDGSAITISQLMSTRMACAEKLMDQEQLYGDTLQKVRSFEVDSDGMLNLKNATGEMIIKLAPGQ